MSTKAQIGGYNFNAEIARGRGACQSMRMVLTRMMNDASTHLTRAQIGQAALVLAEIQDVIARLDEIGRDSKGVNHDEQN